MSADGPTPADIAWVHQVRTALKDDLRAAMRAGDRGAVRVLRRLLGALDNATAVPVGDGDRTPDTHPFGALGVGAAEAARAVLSPDDVAAIVADEVLSLTGAASEYRRLGRTAEADEALAGADVAARYLRPVIDPPY